MVAFLLLVGGGGRLGAILHERLSSGAAAFSGPWLQAWLVRADVSLALYYERGALAPALAKLPDSAALLDPARTLAPAFAVFGMPFTSWDPLRAANVFVIYSVLALVAALAVLGAGRVGHWNRTDWILFAGLAVVSAPAGELVRSAEPMAFALLAAAVVQRAAEARRLWVAAGGLLLLGPGFGPAWLVPLFWVVRGKLGWALLALSCLGLGALGAALLTGSSTYPAYFAAIAESTQQPVPLAVQSLSGLLSRALIGHSAWNSEPLTDAPSWIGPLVLLGLSLLVTLQAFRFRKVDEADTIARGLPVAVAMLAGSLFWPGGFGSRNLYFLLAAWCAMRLAAALPLGPRTWLAAALALAFFPWPLARFASPSVLLWYPEVWGGVAILAWIWVFGPDALEERRRLFLQE